MKESSRFARIRAWPKWDVVIPLLAVLLILGVATGLSTWQYHQCASRGGHMARVHVWDKKYTCVGGVK